MITVYTDMEVLSHAAAELFAQESLQAVALRGRFVVLLAGGETPRRTYQLLAAAPFKDRVPWQAVHIFWGDERYVPADDPRSNARMVQEELLDHVPVPTAQVHPIPYNCSPHESAREYEQSLRTFFADGAPRFDLVFLGLGNNGHTASLFPGTPALEEQQRWVVEVTVTEETLNRITLTAPLINQAECIAFLVAGAGKAHILHEVLEGSPDPHHVPARLIKPDGRLLWLVDRAAARLLGNTFFNRDPGHDARKAREENLSGEVKRRLTMSYCFSKKVALSFDEAIVRVTEELKKEGFGILTEIDVTATLKKKLDVDFRNYRILGACNPPFAYRALLAEPHIGTMLPCNVIVQELDDGTVEVAAVDPLASMQAIENKDLQGIAEEIQLKLKKIIEQL